MTPDCERRRDRFLRRVRRLGLEGVVWKRIDSAYEPGERSGAWIDSALTWSKSSSLAVTFRRARFRCAAHGRLRGRIVGTKPMAEILTRIDRIKIA